MAQGYGTRGQYRGTPKKISLTNGFANAINLPRHITAEGDFALYPHGEGSKISVNRPKSWYKAAEKTYNSPSNARVVCLSNDGANVLYWAPLIKDGKVSGQLELASSYTFDKSAKKGVEQHINVRQFTWDNAGLQALVSPVVFSNIEELWISADILNCSRYKAYYNQLYGLQPGQVVGVNFLSALLEQEISTGSKVRTIAETFPLLRAIVVVKTVENSPVQDFHKCAVRTDAAKYYLEKKYPNQRRAIGENFDLMQQIAKNTGFAFAIQPISTGNILKFGLGDYKYDELVLVGFKEKLLQKYGPQKAKPVEASVKVTPEPVVEAKKEVSKPEAEVKVEEPVKEEVAEVDTSEGSLASIIKSMEDKSFKTTEIKKALWAYKQHNPEFFKRQVGLLPKDIYDKYADALK